MNNKYEALKHPSARKFLRTFMEKFYMPGDGPLLTEFIERFKEPQVIRYYSEKDAGAFADGLATKIEEECEE